MDVIPNETDRSRLGRTITKQKNHLFLDHQYRRMKFINEHEQGIIGAKLKKRVDQGPKGLISESRSGN